MNARIRLEAVACRYRNSRTGGQVDALSPTTLEVSPGEILAVAGPNGSGKSTLLETMAFLRRPDEGRIMLDDSDPWKEDNLLAARRRVPMLLQKTVLFSMSAAANVAYGLQVRGIPPLESATLAGNALDTVGLSALANRRHNELSFGEKRRVALARVLVLDAPVMVLDEPFAGLDPDSAGKVRMAIKLANNARNATIILSCHTPADVAGLTTRVINIAGGKLA